MCLGKTVSLIRIEWYSTKAVSFHPPFGLMPLVLLLLLPLLLLPISLSNGANESPSILDVRSETPASARSRIVGPKSTIEATNSSLELCVTFGPAIIMGTRVLWSYT